MFCKMSDLKEIKIEKVREDLKALDERRFEKRAERLMELRKNSLSITGDFPSKASNYLDEASNCYINGNFRACIFACSVSADQILRHEIIKLSKNKFKTLKKLERNTFGFCIKYFYDTIKNDSFNCQLNYTIRKFETINKIRNILSIHPAYVDFGSNRFEEDKLRDKLISEDVYRIYELLYSLLYPAHLAGEKMKHFLKHYIINFTRLKKEGKDESMKASMYDVLKNNFNVEGNYFGSDAHGTFTVEQELLQPLAFNTYRILGDIIKEIYGEKNETN